MDPHDYAPLRWTREAPTQTGFYWAQAVPTGAITVVHLAFLEDGSICLTALDPHQQSLDCVGWGRFSDRPLVPPSDIFPGA
jgi:hypothetical protein